MDPEYVREVAERDQLWASLRTLRPEIDRLAAGMFGDSDREQAMIRLLARVVAAEMDFRLRDANEA